MFPLPARAAQHLSPRKVIKIKWGLAFGAGRQALTGSLKASIGPHLGIIVPWASLRGLGWVFFCAVPPSVRGRKGLIQCIGSGRRAQS